MGLGPCAGRSYNPEGKGSGISNPGQLPAQPIRKILKSFSKKQTEEIFFWSGNPEDPGPGMRFKNFAGS
jgi:hypothetical protein